jgi:DNA modification methylase
MSRIVCGDALTELKKLPDESVHCCVTSPPYWGLRDYGVPGQLGLEKAPEEYVEKMVAVFAEVRRALRNDGTLWLNLGDSYAADRGGTHQPAETLAGGRHGKTVNGEKVNRGRNDSYNPSRNAPSIGLKHKDLVGIPWRVAFALQSAGWYLRQDIIWSKPNPMPESVTDRCTKAHEYIFLLSKSARYFYDNEAVKEPYMREWNENNGGNLAPVGFHKRNDGFSERGGNYPLPKTGANRRSVWTISTKPFSEAHFATFPPEIPEICIKAGCPPHGIVLDPFGGAGTVGLVAEKLGREYILIELNPKYVEMAEQRIERDCGTLLRLPEPTDSENQAVLL